MTDQPTTDITARIRSDIEAARAPQHELTREDLDFIGRITRAVVATGLGDHEMWLAFKACSCAWGPRSAPALGCLLDLVRAAWAFPHLRAVVDVDDMPCQDDPNERFSVEVLLWSDEFREYEPMVHKGGRSQGGGTFSGPTRGEVLALALEAARDSGDGWSLRRPSPEAALR